MYAGSRLSLCRQNGKSHISASVRRLPSYAVCDTGGLAAACAEPRGQVARPHGDGRYWGCGCGARGRASTPGSVEGGSQVSACNEGQPAAPSYRMLRVLGATALGRTSPSGARAGRSGVGA